MNAIARFIGWTLATVVNFISDLLYLVSRPLWMRFGLWITSLQEGEIMRKSRKLQKRVKRENRIRLSQHNKMLRAIAKRKSENNSENSEEKAKVLDQTVDNV